MTSNARHIMMPSKVCLVTSGCDCERNNYKQPTTLDIEVTRLWTNCYGLDVNNEAHKCLLKNKLVPNGVDSAVMLIFCRTKCVVAFNLKKFMQSRLFNISDQNIGQYWTTQFCSVVILNA